MSADPVSIAMDDQGEKIQPHQPEEKRVPEPASEEVTMSPPLANQVTMTVRTQQGSPMDMSDQPEQHASNGKATEPVNGEKVGIETVSQKEKEDARNDSPLSPKPSPPMEIEADEPEMIDNFNEGQFIQISGDEGSLSADILDQFPFVDRFASCVEAAKAMATHIDRDDQIMGDFFGSLAHWFETQVTILSQHGADWDELYLNERDLWEQVATIFIKLFTRRVHFGTRISVIDAESGLTRLLRSYVKIVARLLETDVILIRETPLNCVQKPLLFSPRHLKALWYFLHDQEEPVLRDVLDREYRLSVDGICQKTLFSFLEDGTDGMKYLANLCQECMARIYSCPTYGHNVLFILRLAGETNRLASKLYRPRSFPVDAAIGPYPSQAIALFRAVHNNLFGSVHKLPSSTSADLRRLFYLVPGRVLHTATFLNKDIAGQTFDDFVGVPGACQLNDRGTVAMYFWKVRFLKEYICGGKMDTRVFGIETMSQELVDFYKTQGEGPGSQGALMQLVAQLLLDEKIIEYIVGVDSHPQLIQRSSNILGFLVVTNKYTNETADIVWQALAKSQDPRVAAATVEMLSHSMQLMPISDLLYLFGKLDELPSDAFQNEILGFMTSLAQFFPQRQPEWMRDTSRMVPFRLLVRLLQDTSAPSCPIKNYREVHEEASRLICLLGRATDREARRELYTNCAARINTSNDGATGEIQALSHVARLFKTDHTFLTGDLGLSSLVLKDLQRFQHQVRETSNESKLGPMQSQIMKHSLNLLLTLLLHDCDSLPLEEYNDLWETLCGSGAVNDDARDQVWSRLADVARTSTSTHPFIDRCIETLLQALQPVHFTTGAFDFVHHAAYYATRASPGPHFLENGILTVPCEGILWRMVLLAREHEIAENVMRLLAKLYLNPLQLRSVPKQQIEAMHVSVVNRCLTLLLESCGRDGSMTEFEHTAMPFDIPISEEPTQSFSRAIQFLGILLHQVRTNKEFASAPLTAVGVGRVSDEIVGDPVTFSYQAFGDDANPPEIRTAQVGDLETRRDFIQRLAKLTGFSTFQLICAGQKVEPGAFPTQTLRDWGIFGKGLLLIRRTADAPAIIEPNAPIGVYSSAIEAEICSQLKSFYRFLEADDPIAGATYSFLKKFVPTELACIETIHTDPSHVFVHGKPFKVQYSLWCLEAHLNRQRNMGLVEQTFVTHAIQLLLSFILDFPQYPAIISGSEEVEQLCQVSSLCLRLTHEYKPDGDVGIKVQNPEKITSNILRALKAVLASPLEMADVAAYNFYNFLVQSVKFSADIWHAFTSASDVEDMHYLLLVQDNRPGLRSAIAKVIKMVSEQPSPGSRVDIREIAQLFWKMALSIIPRTVESPKTSTDFYGLARDLFAIVMQRHADVVDKASLANHIETWRTILMSHAHEEIVGRDLPDILIFGLATLITYGIQCLNRPGDQYRDDEFMEHVFSSFLFPPHAFLEVVKGGVPLKINHPVLESTTRMALYQLVTTLALERSQFQRLVNLAEGAMLSEEGRYYLYDRSRTLRSSTGHVGIRNLGNTCYMNSLLTQLFMNLQFRRFVLSLPISQTNGSQNLLEETQKLFLKMQNSYIKAADAGELARCIRTYDDAQIDIAIQMDVEEFFNLLFDQWEGQMVSADDKQQFRSFFGGQTVNQIKSKECEHISERSESFIAIQCDVKGKANLFESLQAYVEGDVMEGENKYKCESCGGKFVDAVKRSCLKEVPDNVIFHLKRFDFDLGLMQRSKINDLFEFPMTIDLSKYTVEHLNDPSQPIEPDIFELVGVLLHKGVAEHGHYFSYIRTRHTSQDVEPEWLQFDDSDVTVFNPAEIREKCFGGLSDVKESHFGTEYHTPMLKGYNAYMLFYQRASSIKKDEEEWSGRCEKIPPHVPGPPDLEEQMAHENELILREYCMFDPNHAGFVKFLLDRLRGDAPHDEDPNSHGLHMQVIELVVSHLHQVFGRTKETPIFEDMVTLLKDTLGDCPTCNALALNAFMKDRNGTYALTDLLIRSTLPKVRLGIRQLIIDLLNSLRESDPVSYGLPAEGTSTPEVSDDGILPMVVQALHSSLPGLFWNARAWEDTFGLLCDISKRGIFEISVIFRTGVFSYCFDILVAHHDYRIREDLERLLRCIERRSPPQHRLFELFYHVLMQIDLDADPVDTETERVQEYDANTHMFPPTSHDIERLQMWDPKEKSLIFFNRMLDKWDTARGDEFFLGELVPFLLDAPAHLGITNLLFMTIFEGIEQVAHIYVAPYLLAGLRFCQYAREPVPVVEIIRAAARSTASLDGQGGEFHVRFFNELRKVSNEHLTASIPDGEHIILDTILELTPNWGYRLLSYPDVGVREESVQLLSELLYETAAVPEIVDGPADGGNVVDPLFLRRMWKTRELLKTMMHKAENVISSEVFSKRGMQELMEVMNGMANWLHLVHQTAVAMEEDGHELAAEIERFRADDEALVERCMNCTGIYEQWPNSDEHEEIQSDNAECWGVSDMSGDSDDGVEAET
ncbi:hypothetical protein P152DRAFT_473658 [Eremomyces bilateralis CBS 781.70]|uniref:USP domain-containing protein n=1 Tax=Eremomyces bilateralis CBS 781.70 TaxID=1392243 RepID=A0A6G1G371_9PEZI|nr:uncharacterized protein P152DRAFT_473658 [Eremomyces bilateralis CBS 781.70]KAF1812493.1 hypothetical protein P152DRAFT_473658 [Eremomyces bilateralis CBS 781.70]